MPPISRSALLNSLPPSCPDDPIESIRSLSRQAKRKLIVLDDDPTGTQTVHGLSVLTNWSVEQLCAELLDDRPAVFLFTNSRSMTEPTTRVLYQEIARNLVAASKETGRDFTVVSRSDSTLRGHFPAEMEELQDSLEQEYDAWVLCPFFEEGGRITVSDTHYVTEGDSLIPAADTPFAKDKAFGYKHSNLVEWVIEKSEGRIPKESIVSLSIDDIRLGKPDHLRTLIEKTPKNGVILINSTEYRDLQIAVLALMQAEQSGKRFLYRTAASFVAARSGIERRELLSPEEMLSDQGRGILIVAGSYVPKTSRQIEHLLDNKEMRSVELNVSELTQLSANLSINGLSREIDSILEMYQPVLLYTSRELIQDDGRQGLEIGKRISDTLVAIVRGLTITPRGVITKGGITSSDIATKAFGIQKAEVLGQILPGVPVWRGDADCEIPGVPLVIFPGNVGSDSALLDALLRLS
jgi:uncharacterized protein YgbK (DUF1537 family)